MHAIPIGRFSILVNVLLAFNRRRDVAKTTQKMLNNKERSLQMLV